VKVLTISNALFRSDGIANVALAAARALVDGGHELAFMYPRRDYDQPRLPEWRALTDEILPVRHLSLRRRHLLSTAPGVIAALGAIRRSGADVVHVHQPAHAALAASAARFGGPPTVLHLHGHPGDEPGSAQRRGIHRADQVIGVSESVVEAWVRHGLDRERATVVHNGLDLTHHRPASPQQRAEARADLGIPADAPVIGFVGRFTTAKGVDVLAEAFEQVALVRPEAHLVLVGGTHAQRDTQRALTERLRGHNAHILDAVDDPRMLTDAFDIGVVPSEMEAFSLVVLELLAAGIPVLGSAVGGTPEALGPDLATRLTPFGDANALAAQIDDLLGGDRVAMGANARARGAQFDAPNQIGRIVDILRSAADGD